MVEITQSDIALFSAFLLSLKQFVSSEDKDYKFYSRWQSQIEHITEVSEQLDRYLATKDAQTAHQVERSKRIASYQNDEFTAFAEHVPYYLTGIDTYNREMEGNLIGDGLLDKPIQEMTGFEFKTLLLVTLNEHQRRQKE